MLEAGDQIDIWVVEKALGHGGMGSVYRCRNRSARRILAAVKVLESSVRRLPGAEERFIREAEILFALDHPNIVKVRNVRTDLDPPYLEMEFVEGESLEHMLRRGALPFASALDLMRQISDAVAYLHARGVRHRDIKPANLLVEEAGTVKLVDFGLAMEADQSRLTQGSMTFGTVSYAPPEWAQPEALDPEMWDIYACGVVFWEMLTGQVAFPVTGQGSARQQAMQVILAKQSHPPLDPGARFHGDMRQLIADMTHSVARKRCQSMGEVRDRVEQLDPTLARSVGETLAPYFPDDPNTRTWVPNDTPGGTPMRDEWARALAATPAPAPEPGEVPGDGVDTLIRTPTPAPSGPRRRRPRRMLLPGLLALSGLVIAAVAVTVVITQLWDRSVPLPSQRPVDVVLTGLPPAAEAQVVVAGVPAPRRVSWVYKYGAVPVGETDVVVVIGRECPLDACPGAGCPAWCGTSVTPVAIEPGTSVQTITVDVEPPPVRTVGVALPDGATDWAAVIASGSTLGVLEDDGTAVIEGLGPGRHPVRVTLGDCPEDAWACWPDGECPRGCRSWTTEVVVPYDAVPAAVVADMPLPEAAPAVRPVPVPVAPSPAPIPASAVEGAVTAADFATWLAGNPGWQRDAVLGAGGASDSYLADWSGSTPPAGTASRAMVNVTWGAAAAYCAGRGGLRALDAEPTEWAESAAQPYLEWRVSGGRRAWRDSEGRESFSVGEGDANAWTGFRCAR